MITTLKKEIARLVQGRILTDELLAPYTTWRVGGLADMYVAPVSYEATLALITLLAQEHTPYMVLGGGSNILFSDAGYRGVVIQLAQAAKHCVITDNRIVVGAGVSIQHVIQETVAHGLSGFEPLCGIPGTVGGALYGNAGVPDTDIARYLEYITLINKDGVGEKKDASELEMNYRQSALETLGMVWEAVFQLTPGKIEQMQEYIRVQMQHRKAVQPLGKKTAGSVFKNPQGYTAGALLDECGCKGMVQGGATVSDLHANFIINSGGARAVDIQKLMLEMKQRVQEQTGIHLESEVRVFA